MLRILAMEIQNGSPLSETGAALLHQRIEIMQEGLSIRLRKALDLSQPRRLEVLSLQNDLGKL
jgi:hypothetical protein